jgi:hypothetical protein
VIVQHLEPTLDAFLAPLEVRGLRLVAAALVIGEDLRVDHAIAHLAAELRIDSVHALVDSRARLQFLRVQGRVGFVRGGWHAANCLHPQCLLGLDVEQIGTNT